MACSPQLIIERLRVRLPPLLPSGIGVNGSMFVLHTKGTRSNRVCLSKDKMLHLDFETASELDVSEVGTWRYATHPSTKALMLGYSFGNERSLWEPHLEPMPKRLLDALCDPWCPLAAWHSQFERLVLWKVLDIYTDIDRWTDPMIRARYCSLPGSLEKVAKILDTQTKKMATKNLFKKNDSLKDMFCKPLRMGGEITLFGVEPTTYRDWDTHPKEWKLFREYCMDDVAAEEEILEVLKEFDLPDWEYELWKLDQEINDRGIFIDPVLLQGSMLVVERARADLRKKLIELTKLSNVNSNPQILAFVRQHGYSFSSIGKAFVKRALGGDCNLDDVAKEVLNLRTQLAKTGVNKLEACKKAVDDDGRIHHILSFYGAARTGRWSGSLLQPQNLVKASKEVESKYERALELLKAADYDSICKEYSSPLDVASAAIRPILRAKPGSTLVIADLNAIESRGAAWISGCNSLMEVFRNGRDPYCAFAALIDPTKTYEYFYHEWKVLGKKTNRTNAKPATLGCGYGLSGGTVEIDDEGNDVKTGLLGYADSMGIELAPDFAQKCVDIFRNAYPEIPQAWYALQEAFAKAVQTGELIELDYISMQMRGKVLCLKLPSGRSLHYINPKVTYEEKISKRGNKYQAMQISYEGIDQVTRQWTRVDTWGGKIFENVVQAICRDILAYGMVKATERGFVIVLHVHDELVAEVPEDSNLGVEELVECMCEVPDWAPGFLIGAEGFKTNFYRKE